MSDSLILATQMIDDGAISTINDIVKVRVVYYGPNPIMRGITGRLATYAVAVALTLPIKTLINPNLNPNLNPNPPQRGGLEDNVVGNLTIALVNLTRVSGKEGQVVEATIHQVRVGLPGSPLAPLDLL